MYQDILWETRDRVGIVTLNRPQRLNAISNAMRLELEDVLRRAEADADVWTLVLTGAGRGFCSGADLKARAAGDGGGGPPPQPMFEPQYYYSVGFGELSKPVIAAVNGVVRGAGCNMVFAADFRIASEQATFGANFVERGLMGETAAYYLPRLVGLAVATEVCLLGEPFDAQQAKAWGIVNEVVPHERLLDAALALAARLNARAPQAVRMTKLALRRAYDQTALQHLEMQNSMNGKLRTTADNREALAAFIEKRSPVFTGR
jgi:2-(1,2-epoxy-1,2-dihydrophenyl)acetyl-CoA isomerase